MNAPSRSPLSSGEAFLPGCEGEELKLRERLLKGRNMATARLHVLQSANARALLWMMIETASAWVFVSASTDDLRAAANHCVRLFMCADFFERMPSRPREEVTTT